MKINTLLLLFTITLFVSCGSSEKVITNDGTVYTVKGSKIYQDNKDVTSELSRDERRNVLNTLEQRLTAEEKLKEQQETLEKQRKEAERKQDALEDAIREKERATKDYMDAKEKLADERKTYEKRLKKGDLSPNEVEEWKEKLTKLEKRVDQAQRKLNKL